MKLKVRSEKKNWKCNKKLEVKKGGSEKNCNKKLEVKKRLEVKERV